MPQQIILRKGTAAAWTAAGSVVLAAGEPGFETDTGKLKIGDGTSAWTALGYVNEDFPTVPTNLADLLDVASTAPSTGQVLKWTGTEWAPGADSTGTGGGASSIDELSDVLITGTPTTGQVLSYDGVTWTNSGVPTDSLDITDLNDVVINPSTLASGQVLKYNGTNWANNADEGNLTQVLSGGTTPGGGATMTLSNGGGSFKLLPGTGNISFAVTDNDITVSTTDLDTTYSLTTFADSGLGTAGLRFRNNRLSTDADITFAATPTAVPVRFGSQSIGFNARNTRYSQTLSVVSNGVDLTTLSPFEATGLVATLATGTNIVTLTSGTTLGLYAGLSCFVTTGTGRFATGAVIESVDSSTQLTMTANHTTAGSATFNVQYYKKISFVGNANFDVTNPSGDIISFEPVSVANPGTVGRVAVYSDASNLRAVQSSNDGLTWDQATRYLVVTSGRLALRQTDFQMLHNSYGTGARSDGFQYAQYFSGDQSKAWNIIRGRGTSTAPAAITSNDEIFELRAYGQHGTAAADLAVAANMRFIARTITPGFVGADILFSTSNGSSAATPKLIIREDGNVEINTITAIGVGGNGDLVLAGIGTGTVRLPAGATVGGVAIGTIIIQGSVANAAALPGTSTVGYLYLTADNGHGHIWNGTAWIDVGAIQGPAGVDGADGSNGTAATIAVGTVTTGAAGSSATVTNAGTSLAATFNFSIPKGDTGDTGDAATIAVGTVTTGAPGSSVAVTNTGTSGAAVFDFTIPAGDNGADGDDGVDGQTILNGAVDPTTEGADGDFYINTVTNEIFGPKATTWGAGTSLVGPAGADGTNGVDGLSIDNIARTSGDGSAGSLDTYTITYTDASSDTFTVQNGADGADGTNGTDGDDGVDGQGVPVGGTAGQLLAKIDGDDYNTEWIDAPSGGSSSNSFSTIAVSGQSSVVADSSTDSLTLVAGTNITITTDASTDTITINSTGGGGGSMATRAALSGATSSLAADGTGPINITGYKSYMLMKVATSAAAWVRIYTSEAARIADASRTEGTDPAPGAGVIAEVITTGAQTVLISPGALGWNDESTVTTNIPVRVTNKSGATAAITVTLTALQLEA